MIIEDVHYRLIFDSRGKETVECEITAGDVTSRAAAPSGASTGSYEAVVVNPYKYQEIEEKVSRALIGLSVFDQEGIDDALSEIDGTDNFKVIGGNFAISASLAAAKCAAEIVGLPLYAYLGGIYSKEIPYPLGNVLGGGRHAPGSTDIQEYLIVPVGAKNFFEAQRTNSQVHRMLKDEMDKKGIFAAKGDEGAWAAKVTDEEAFDLLYSVISKVDLEVKMGIDVAASELWNGREYCYKKRKLDKEGQINYILELADKYDLFYIEDPLHEEDFEGFAEITKQLKCLICGDDLFVTNTKRLEKGVRIGAANTILIKPNQIGTVTGTYKAVKLAKENGYNVVVSHRSGETEDASIAHLAVAFNAKLIKTGVVGGERTAKLNEVIRIEEFMDKPRMVKL